MKPITSLTIAALLALEASAYAQVTITPVAADPAARAPVAAPDTAAPAPLKPVNVTKAEPKPHAKSTAKKTSKTSATSKKKPARPAKAFSGTLTAVDRLMMTFTVEDREGTHTYCVTSNTRFYQDGKPAIFSAAVVGEDVSGTGRKSEAGQIEAVSVKFAARPKSEAPAALPKTETPAALPKSEAPAAPTPKTETPAAPTPDRTP